MSVSEPGAGLPTQPMRLVLLSLLLVAVMAGEGRAQISPAGPAPLVVSVGTALVVPMANLGRKSPGDFTKADPNDGRYATTGTALTQRIGFAPFESWGVFVQALFPAFGVDEEVLQEHWGVPVTGGGNMITSWSLGIRWRQGRSWMKGLYLEAMAGRYRDRLEVEVSGAVSDTAFSWEPGWGIAAGYVFKIAPSFAVDTGVALHEFKEDYFINRWVGCRFLAVLTFGGKR